MSASEEQRAEWLGASFWERLDRLEVRHQRIQTEHETVRRNLERVTPREADELLRKLRQTSEPSALTGFRAAS